MSIHNNLKCPKCGRPLHPGACAGGSGGEEEQKKQDKASKADATSTTKHQKTDKLNTTVISKSLSNTLCTLWGNYHDKRTVGMNAPKPNTSKKLTKEAKTEVSVPKTSDLQKTQASTGSKRDHKNNPFNIRLTR